MGLFAPEKWAWRLGYRRVAGTDEAGRGALAGPLVAASVVLPDRKRMEGLENLNDSKKLDPSIRRELFRHILGIAEDWAISCVPASEIDRTGVQPNNIAAIREAVMSLRTAPELVLVDYYHVSDLDIPQWSIIHGDRLSGSIAAASIMAKVVRDQLMWFWSLKYPQYGFDANKGYGTERHVRALRDHGPAPCHRLSFHGVIQMEMGFLE
ncbi:MAG: ribonuclease HII [Actinomycetota bacterium]|nr:ribonuclease HII [Actinomycetota bacterium]